MFRFVVSVLLLAPRLNELYALYGGLPLLLAFQAPVSGTFANARLRKSFCLGHLIIGLCRLMLWLYIR